eukprot:2503451-Lingulodinium_polyedra.AAC.1
MILLHFEALQNVASWCEGCSCHEHILTQNKLHRRSLDLQHELGDKFMDCPMKGKRGPELACGQVQAMLSSTLQADWATFMEDRSETLLSTDWDIVATDNEACKNLITTALATKMKFYTLLPWVLMGLAHHDEHAAKACGRSALDQWDRLPIAARAEQHPISI